MDTYQTLRAEALARAEAKGLTLANFYRNQGEINRRLKAGDTDLAVLVVTLLESLKTKGLSYGEARTLSLASNCLSVGVDNHG